MSKRDLDCGAVKEKCFSTGERRNKDKAERMSQDFRDEVLDGGGDV